jgi:rhomboid family GlyGly-CTERM serine protease
LRVGDVPAGTAAILFASLVASAPSLGDLLCYDRAAILRGELWRLLTGHWVHFSAAHLLWNGVALAIAGGLLEWRRERWAGLLLLLAPLAISGLLLALEPALSRFAGLSGVVFAALTYLALSGLREPGSWRQACLVALALLLLKLGHEVVWGRSIFAGGGLRPVATSHAAGALCGAIAWSVSRRAGRAGRPAQAQNGREPPIAMRSSVRR